MTFLAEYMNSLFLTLQMRGFSVGGTTEYRTATTRSREGEEREEGFR